MHLREEKREAFEQIQCQREWVLRAEHILDGSWVTEAHVLSNAEVERRFDHYLKDNHNYPTGMKVSDEEQQVLHLLRDAFHSEWNYTILPSSLLPSDQLI